METAQGSLRRNLEEISSKTKIQKLIIFGSAPNNGMYNLLSSIGDNVNYKYNCEICVEKFQCHYNTGDNTAFHNIVGQIALYDVINQVEFWFKTNKYDLNNLSLKLQTYNGALVDLNAVDFVLHLKVKFYV